MWFDEILSYLILEMTSVANLNHFNNLLYNTHRRAVYDKMEHLAGRVPLDLSPKKPAPITRVINAGAQQLTLRHEHSQFVRNF